MSVKWFKIGALSGALAVALGAFGAHALKPTLETTGYLETYKTGVLYHFIHTILILIICTSPYHQQRDKSRINIVAVLGILLFSGSLYLLSTLGWLWLGPITPIGGVLFIAAWIMAFMYAKKKV